MGLIMSTAPRRLRHPLDGVALFHDVSSVEALTAGWLRIYGNGGAAGGDGIRIVDFAVGVAERLVALSRALRDGSYQPGPLRRVDIPKKNGGTRRLTIPPVGDRVAQSAAAQILTPLLDREFEDGSFGYRPGRSVADAVKRVEALRREGFVWTVDADIDDFFDSIPVDRLMDRLVLSITESPLVDLIARWLEEGASEGRGIAQGSPLSPLLANLYLDELDETFSGAGLRIVRYADDFVVLAKSRPAAEAALARIGRLLADHGLALDRDKTRLASYDASLKFLGTTFIRSWAMRLHEGEDGPTPIEKLLAEIAASDAREETALKIAAESEERAKLGGYDRGLRLLHVGEPGRRLTLRNQSFAVREAPDRMAPGKARELVVLHPSRIDRIEIGPRAEVDLDALKQALAFAIPLAFVDGHGRTLGQLAPVLGQRAGRHMAQARAMLDPEKRLGLARTIVEARINNQRAFLRRVNHRRGVTGVDETAARLGRIVRKCRVADDVDALMGVEGEAAALYWRAFGSLLLNGFAFGPRRRRQDSDPVNIALDVLSGLLARDVGAVLLRVGLHPGFGVLHTAGDGRDACVYDLMEIFRAGLIESVVLTAINGGRLTVEMFDRLPDGTCHMQRSGMAALIRAYEERAEHVITDPESGQRMSWRRLMIAEAEGYAAAVEGRRPFVPYVMDH